MTEVLLEVEGIYKSYQTPSERLEVLTDLTLQVNRGEFVAIQGASGSGKSTLLHLCGGLDRPDQGRIRMASKEKDGFNDISQMSESDRNRFRGDQIGFVFQAHHLLSELDAVENVMLPALIRGENLDSAKERARQLLESVGLGERFDHRPNQLSGGESQRVAIARAMINRPTLLLMDEPTGNLDRERSDKIFEVIHQIHSDENQTVMVVTHDQGIAYKATRYLYLEYGKLLESPQESS